MGSGDSFKRAEPKIQNGNNGLQGRVGMRCGEHGYFNLSLGYFLFQHKFLRNRAI